MIRRDARDGVHHGHLLVSDVDKLGKRGTRSPSSWVCAQLSPPLGRRRPSDDRERPPHRKSRKAWLAEEKKMVEQARARRDPQARVAWAV